MSPIFHIIYASTSGNTEYVIDTIVKALHAQRPDLRVDVQRAEKAQADDLLRGDLLILASGTWNTGGNEGQLNPHMHAFLEDRAKDANLQKKPFTCVSLGDERYYYRTRCTEHFLRFQREHNAVLAVPPLILVNEPYGQEDRIQKWTKRILSSVMQATEAV